MTLVERTEHDGWVELRMNRVDKRNALSNDLVDELSDAIRGAQGGAGLVLRANGPVFCAGADIKEGISLSDDRPSSRLMRCVLESPLFIVAVVEGPAYGAGAMLLALCPVVLATPHARIGFPEANRGFYPAGVVPYFDGVVPSRRLLEMGMNASDLDATEAAIHGVVSEVVESELLEGRVKTWMDLVNARPAVARHAKRVWSLPFEGEEFRARTATVEAILADQVPGAAKAVGPPTSDTG